jgi:serine phosphatase RsbU (regulator of sigma subunit)
MNVLLVNPKEGLPDDTSSYLTSIGYAVDVAPDYLGALDRARETNYDAVVVSAPADTNGDAHAAFDELMQLIDAGRMAAIVLSDAGGAAHPAVDRRVEVASRLVSKEEIQGKLLTVRHYHGLVRAMERDLDNMQRLFKQLNIQFTEVDQEMQLAGRLQVAFLPKKMGHVEQVSFATLYRPATFVSGDIYDIYRVDEDHIAFYVADAVGHGMAASLLTMFIKNAVVSKRVYDTGYQLIDADGTLRLLNRKLIDQNLPNSQFVTACYAMFNTRTYELQFARAGHPYPMLCSCDGNITELKTTGGLLGLFEDEEFPKQTITLRPGEKIIMYSDGVELAFGEAADRPDELTFYREVFQDIAHLPPDQVVSEFGRILDREAGSLNPKDDITLLVMQVNEPK